MEELLLNVDVWRLPRPRERECERAEVVIPLILEKYGRILEKPGEIVRNAWGKPYYPNSDLSFNVSHSGDYLLAAITRRRSVGVDIEKNRNPLDLSRVARHCFSDREMALYLTAPVGEQREQFFFKLWTLKESVSKAIGLGLSYPLKTLDIDLETPYPTLNNRPESWRLRSIESDLIGDDSYFCAVAASGPDFHLRLRS